MTNHKYFYMSIASPRFIIDDLNELLNEKSSWSFTLESNSGFDSKYLKYNECKTVDDITAINPDYLNDIEDGAWNYRLDSLEDGTDLFKECDELTSFNVGLPNLVNGDYMFYYCTNLTSFNSDLSSLEAADSMFRYCPLDGASIRRILAGKDETGNDIIGRMPGKLVCIPSYDDYSEERLIGLQLDTQDGYDAFVEITGRYHLWTGTTSREAYKGWYIQALTTKFGKPMTGGSND